MDKSSLSESQIETLIKMVELRPCIWDKSCNKDSAKKNSAWLEIFNHFSDGKWDHLSPTDQKQIGEMYQAKWRNLRDTFVRSINTGSTYKYHEQLKFLLKNDSQKRRAKTPPSDPSPSSISSIKKDSSVEAGPSSGIQKRSSISVGTPIKKKKICVPKISQSIPSVSTHDNARPPTEITVASSSSSVTDANQGMDEDDAFWHSIKPYMKHLSDLQKIEFRKQAYITIQNILTKSDTVSSDSAPQIYEEIDIKEEYTVSDSE